MRLLFHRKFVTILLMAIGLLVMIGGDVDAGAMFDAAAIAYWVAVGWWERMRHRARAARPAATFTAQVTGRSARRSDGARGAASRLDPAWRDWLGSERR